MSDRDLFLEKDMAWLRTTANITYGDEVGDAWFDKCVADGQDFDTIWSKLVRPFLRNNPIICDYVERVDWVNSHQVVWDTRAECQDKSNKAIHDLLDDYQRSLLILPDSTNVPLCIRINKLIKRANDEAALALKLRNRLFELNDPMASE